MLLLLRYRDRSRSQVFCIVIVVVIVIVVIVVIVIVIVIVIGGGCCIVAARAAATLTPSTSQRRMGEGTSHAMRWMMSVIYKRLKKAGIRDGLHNGPRRFQDPTGAQLALLVKRCPHMRWSKTATMSAKGRKGRLRVRLHLAWPLAGGNRHCRGSSQRGCRPRFR